MPLMTLIEELGHEWLAATPKYLEDVKPEETEKRWQREKRSEA
jgi:hypothetical protein